jgi:tetratricopeptide (TPR) repeat protein
LQYHLIRQSRLAEAEKIANDALALADNEKHAESLATTGILMDLAETKSALGKHVEAEELARRVVEINRRKKRDHHPDTGHALWYLGYALKGQQKFAEAEAVLRESLAIFRENYPSEHYSIQRACQQLNLVLEAKGDRVGLDALAREEAVQAIRSNSPDYHVRLAELLLSNNPSDAQTEEAHRLIRAAIDEYCQVAADSPDDLDRRLKAATGFLEVKRICAAATGFTNEVDEVNRRVMAELPQIELVTKRLTDPAVTSPALYHVALIQLRLGDKAGYRATCKALINMPDDSANLANKWRPIWTPCLAPDALDDLPLHVRRAEEYLAKTPQSESHVSLYLLGAAHYRAAQYNQAAQRLQESIAAYPSDPAPGYDTIYYQQLLLAITKWQLGERDAARRLFAETQRAVDKELQAPSSDWNRRATLELLRAEAGALIEPKKANEAVENKNRPDKESSSNSVEQVRREKT